MNKYKFERGFDIRRFVIILSVILIICYGVFNARNLLLGPSIDIWTPTAEAKTNEAMIVIKGQAKNIASISLNERPISVDPDGIFQERLLLSPGFNTIEVKAMDRFKQETLESIRVYCNAESPTTTITIMGSEGEEGE
jgi:hypothetical protein